jgi:gliding motility-associatede transport system auxiliary component
VRRSNSLLGLVGLILLLFAGVAGLLTRARSSFDVLYIFVNGLFGLFAVIAYLSAGLEHLRAVVSERSTKYGANALVSSVVFLAVLGLLNYISTRHHHRFDLTEQGVFSLSPQSANVVKSLQDDLQIQAFAEGGTNPELRGLLESYAYNAPKVKFELIDPDRQPELAEKYHITAYNTVRFEYGKESTTITQPTEENITNAIIKVTRTTHKTICVVEGHGEPDIDDAQNARGLSSVKEALSNENYEVKKVLLASMASVPDDCNLVVVAGPQKPYLETELTALGTYLDGGGRALFLIAPRSGQEFGPLLAKWGVKLGNDVVVDQVIRLFQGPALGLAPLVNTYGVHEITHDFKQRTVFPMTRSVHADGAGKKGLQATELVKTSPQSWGETDLDGLFQRQEAVLDPNTDVKGPVPIAVAVTADLKQMGNGKDGTTRLAVFGSVEFAENREIGGTYYNRDLLLNTLDWLAGQADLLSIRPRGVRSSKVQFTAEQGTVIFYLSVLIIPELLLIAGIAVWWRRE